MYALVGDTHVYVWQYTVDLHEFFQRIHAFTKSLFVLNFVWNHCWLCHMGQKELLTFLDISAIISMVTEKKKHCMGLYPAYVNMYHAYYRIIIMMIQ